MSVTASPSQIVFCEAEAVTVGLELTPMVMVDVFVQPPASVPVTVYVVVDEGFTMTEEPVNDPGIHV